MGTEKNYQKFFAASPSGEPMAPSWNQRLEKNGTFFDMREGVTLIIFIQVFSQSVHSMNSGTSRNATPSNIPRSVMRRAGMTVRARNERYMKGSSFHTDGAPCVT